jgi:hypothetical protein
LGPSIPPTVHANAQNHSAPRAIRPARAALTQNIQVPTIEPTVPRTYVGPPCTSWPTATDAVSTTMMAASDTDAITTPIVAVLPTRSPWSISSAHSCTIAAAPNGTPLPVKM